MTGAALIMVICAPSARAQSDPPQPHPDPAQSEVSENTVSTDIVVTAQKRAERLQDVPMAITALSSEALTAKGATRLQDFYQQVPGLSVQAVDSGQTGVAIRGVVTGVAGNPTVGITIDDVPVGASTVTAAGAVRIPDLDPSDLQRIEALKGPQGTLYGASSMGGLLKYVTTDADTVNSFGLVGVSGSTVAHGNSGFGIRGAVNTPIVTDVLGVRVSGFYRQDPGYIDNVNSGKSNVNEGRSYGARLGALWKIAPDVSLKVTALYQRDHYLGSSQVEVNYLTRPVYGDLTQIFIPGTGEAVSRSQLYSAAFNAVLGHGLTFTSITGYGISNYKLFRDYSGYAGGAAQALYGVRGAAYDPYAYNTKKFSEEVRIASDQNAPISGLVGAFYTREHSDNNLTLNAYNPTSGAKAGFISQTTDDPLYREYSVFGSARVKIVGGLDIEGGLRYAKNHQADVGITTGASGTRTVIPSSADDSAVTWSVSPRWKVNRDLTVYARVATGFRAGGANAGVAPGIPLTYKSDKTTNYEIGAKGSTPNKVFAYDLSVYRIDWDGIQITSTAVVNNITYSYVGNLGKARINGVEAALQFNPLQDTHLFFNGSYSSSKLRDNLIAAGSIYALRGERLINAPVWSGSAGFDRDFQVSESATLFAGATVGYTGKRYGPFARGAPATGNVRQTLPDYTTIDLRLGLRQTTWTVSAYLNNVTDSRGIIYSSFSAVPATATSRYYANVIRPRTFGVSLQYNFGGR
ncbi:TonB-dependent receptor [Sphingomonas liriopis]|nr:TonB-dependent receptor [Sphingomonas liriopis]